MSCPDCFRGVIHSGTPAGSEQIKYGLSCYVAEPPHGQPASGIVVIIPDAFGWTLPNCRVMADSYAAKGGYKILVPDFMNGKSAPMQMLGLMDKIYSPTSLLGSVLKVFYAIRLVLLFLPFTFTCRQSLCEPRVISFFQNLRDGEAAELPVGAAGFCWGGKQVFRLAQTALMSTSGRPLVDCTYTAHPSRLNFPHDIDRVRVPMSVAQGTKDFAMPNSQVQMMKDILEKKHGDSEVVIYEGAKHGFAIRGDPFLKKEFEQGLEAESQALAWFAKHFKA